jgi:D-aspartate ligase
MAQYGGSPGIVMLGSDFKALGVIRSLGRRGIPSVVIDNHPRAAWYSRFANMRLKWTGPMEGEEFLSFLLQAAKEQRFKRWVLFPSSDEVVEFVARNHRELARVYQLVTQPWGVVRWANDKRLTYRMAEKLGVSYPKTGYPASEADLETMKILFPAIIKPAISIHFQHALRLKALSAENLEELRALYRLAASIIPPEEIMIQEIIPGGGTKQFSVAAYCKEGQTLLTMTARRTRQYPIDYGLSSSFVEAIEVPEIVEPAQRLLQAMGISGMVEIEFKQDQRDGQYKLLDINVRPWGWHTLSLACGIDFSYIEYCDLLGEGPVPIKPRYGAHWVRLITDLPAGLHEIHAGITTPGAYLHSLMGRTVFSVFDWRDPLPACGDFASALWRSLHLRRHKGALKGHFHEGSSLSEQ